MARNTVFAQQTHTFQFGTAIGIARDPRTSYLHSNTLGLGTTNWTSPIGFAGTSSTLDPMNQAAHPSLMIPGSAPGTAPEPVTATQYDRPLLALYGMISDVVANCPVSAAAAYRWFSADAKHNRPGQPLGHR